MRTFTEQELLDCVSIAYQHEFNRIGNNVSSHSQLERWIIQELKAHKDDTCAFSTLKDVMCQKFNVKELEISLQEMSAKREITTKKREITTKPKEVTLKPDDIKVGDIVTPLEDDNSEEIIFSGFDVFVDQREKQKIISSGDIVSVKAIQLPYIVADILNKNMKGAVINIKQLKFMKLKKEFIDAVLLKPKKSINEYHVKYSTDQYNYLCFSHAVKEVLLGSTNVYSDISCNAKDCERCAEPQKKGGVNSVT
ncbi:MAG: hypothetical protein ACE5GV_05990 [Candidatus Scalindua sp.]